DDRRVAALEAEWTFAFECAGPNLRTAKVLQHCDLAARPGSRRADTAKRRAVRFVGAVREVQPEDVGAAGDQRVEHVVGIADRADGRDNFGVTHLVARRSALGARGSGLDENRATRNEPRGPARIPA